jgi:hypothetical protein
VRPTRKEPTNGQAQDPSQTIRFTYGPKRPPVPVKQHPIEKLPPAEEAQALTREHPPGGAVSMWRKHRATALSTKSPPDSVRPDG